MTAALLKASTLGVALFLSSFVAAPILAQDGKTIIVEGQRDKSGRKVCKSTAPFTGTRLGARRTCRTVAEWKEIERESQQLVEHQQQRQQAIDAYKANSRNALANQGPP